MKNIKLQTLREMRRRWEQGKNIDLVPIFDQLEKWLKIMHQCDHPMFIKSRAGGRRCSDCNKSTGWWCPTGPNNECEYDWENDPVGDNCIYCGEPEERK